MLKKIISGGQTGADQGGLEAALELGLEVGGYAPAGFRTEVGSRYDLLHDHFGLTEGPSGNTVADDYRNRTELNVKYSDGTVIFGNLTRNEPGSLLTLSQCNKYTKPVLTLKLDNLEMDGFLLKEWLIKYNVKILNVAGNRGSKNPGIQERVRNFLIEALSRS